MAETYGWGPDEVNRLTMFQLAVYLGAITPEHGRIKMKPDQAMSYLRKKRSLK